MAAMRYSAGDPEIELHLICGEGEAFERLPQRIRSLGPWTGGREGELRKLSLHYRLMLEQQGFVVIWATPSKFHPEHP